MYCMELHHFQPAWIKLHFQDLCTVGSFSDLFKSREMSVGMSVDEGQLEPTCTLPRKHFQATIYLKTPLNCSLAIEQCTLGLRMGCGRSEMKLCSHALCQTLIKVRRLWKYLTQQNSYQPNLPPQIAWESLFGCVWKSHGTGKPCQERNCTVSTHW